MREYYILKLKINQMDLTELVSVLNAIALNDEVNIVILAIHDKIAHETYKT